MTADEQRIAIAEACGWKRDHEVANVWFWKNPNPPPPRWKGDTGLEFPSEKMLPDYLNDLNAMHEAIKCLNKKQRALFSSELINICRTLNTADSEFELLNATATQRAEAFLKTIGKWEETSS